MFSLPDKYCVHPLEKTFLSNGFLRNKKSNGSGMMGANKQ